jgi:uncharacterized protein YraI
MLINFRAVVAGAALVVASAGAAMAYPATVTSALNLRSGPGVGYRVKITMPPGAGVNVHSCGGGWCHLGFRGIQGYASASYLARGGVAVGPSVGIAVLPEYYAYAYRYPPYWRNGYFYYWYGGHWRHVRRDRHWWDRHRTFIRSHRHERRVERRHERHHIRRDRRHERHQIRRERRHERHHIQRERRQGRHQTQRVRQHHAQARSHARRATHRARQQAHHARRAAHHARHAAHRANRSVRHAPHRAARHHSGGGHRGGGGHGRRDRH